MVDIELRSSEVFCFVGNIGTGGSITSTWNVEYLQWKLLLVGAS